MALLLVFVPCFQKGSGVSFGYEELLPQIPPPAAHGGDPDESGHQKVQPPQSNHDARSRQQKTPRTESKNICIYLHIHVCLFVCNPFRHFFLLVFEIYLSSFLSCLLLLMQLNPVAVVHFHIKYYVNLY